MSASTKNVVVIGGGYAGVLLAKDLDSFAHVTLVDRKEVFFHRIASLRASVDGGWTDAPFIPYDRLLEHGTVVLGKAVTIDTGERRVVLATGERLPYDVAVIATGADYPEPARFAGTTAEEAAKALHLHQQRIAAAQRVLVVGGGPSGVELSAEIRLARPDAEVTLAHSGPMLLDGNSGGPRSGRRAQGWLESHKVRVLLDSFVSHGNEPGTYRAPGGRAIQADLVFWTTGITPNTLWLRLAGHSDWLNESGHVRVDEHLRVVGCTDVFAVGDVNDVSEAKVSPSARAQGRAAAHNIRAYLDGPGRHRKQPKPYRPTPQRIFSVPFGPADGVTVLPMLGREGAVLGGHMTAALKGRSLFLSQTRGELGQAVGG